MMRHLQKPVNNVDYTPLEVQFFMDRVDLRTGWQVNNVKHFTTGFLLPLYFTNSPQVFGVAPLLQVRKMNMMLNPRDVLLLGRDEATTCDNQGRYRAILL